MHVKNEVHKIINEEEESKKNLWIH